VDNGCTVVLSGAQAVQFLSTEGIDFWNEGQWRRGQNQAYGADKTLVSTDGAEHQCLRNLQTRGYSRSLVDKNSEALLRVVRSSIEELKIGDLIGIREFLLPIAAHQLGISILDYSSTDHVTDLAVFLENVVRVTLSKQLPASILELPESRRAKDRVMQLADDIVRQHRAPTKADAGGVLVKDLILAFERDHLFSEGDLRAAVLGPFIAGLDQVVNTCAFALYSLLAHPKILDRVRSESDLTFSESATENHSINAQSMRSVVLETLRLYPVAPALQGTTVREFEFAEYLIKADQPIIIGSTVAHFLPEFYSDPFTFDIERHRPPRNEPENPYAFAAFGVGKHRCLAAGFAQDLIAKTLAGILHFGDFEIEPVDYVLVIGGTPAPIPTGLRLRFVGRRNTSNQD
jgi:cytochrome P450